MWPGGPCGLQLALAWPGREDREPGRWPAPWPGRWPGRSRCQGWWPPWPGRQQLDIGPAINSSYNEQLLASSLTWVIILGEGEAASRPLSRPPPSPPSCRGVLAPSPPSCRGVLPPSPPSWRGVPLPPPSWRGALPPTPPSWRGVLPPTPLSWRGSLPFPSTFS